MRVSAMIIAAIAAVVGSGVWGFISWKTGFEIGYIAWGIGLIVGLGSAMAGGRGTAMGVYCGLMALVSIACGKFLAVELSVGTDLRNYAEEQFNQEMYQGIVADAEAFAQLQDESAYPQSIYERAYHNQAEIDQAEDVTQQDIEEFKTFSVPMLQAINNGSLTFEEWKESTTESFVTNVRETVPRVDLLKDNLSPFDLLWAFLGVSTAFKVGGADEEPSEDEQEINQPDDLLTRSNLEDLDRPQT